MIAVGWPLKTVAIRVGEMILLDKIKKSSLVSGAGTYLAASLINAAIPFLMLPILTRYLAPSEYGEVAVFQVWVALLTALCALGAHGAATRKYYDYDNPDIEMGPFITSCILIGGASSAVLLFILLLASEWLSDNIGLSVTWLFFGVPFAFSAFIMQLRLRQWQVRQKPVSYGALQISKSMADMLLSILLVVLLGLGATGRITGSTTAVMLCGLLSAFLLLKDGLIKKTWRPDLIKEALRFGVPLTPHVIGAFLLLVVDRAIVSSQLGLDAAGYYMVAAQFAMIMNILLESLNRAYTPWLFSRLKSGEKKEKIFIVKLTYAYYGFLVLCVVLAFMVADKVLIFVAGEAYAEASHIVAWLVLAQALRGMYFMLTGFIIFSKRTGTLAKITIFCGLTNVVLMVLMIDFFGLKGAAWAACISMLLQWALTWMASARLIPMPWFGSANG